MGWTIKAAQVFILWSLLMGEVPLLLPHHYLETPIYFSLSLVSYFFSFSLKPLYVSWLIWLVSEEEFSFNHSFYFLRALACLLQLEFMVKQHLAGCSKFLPCLANAKDYSILLLLYFYFLFLGRASLYFLHYCCPSSRVLVLNEAKLPTQE